MKKVRVTLELLDSNMTPLYRNFHIEDGDSIAGAVDDMLEVLLDDSDPFAQGADQVDIDETLDMLDQHDCHHPDGCDCDSVRELVEEKLKMKAQEEREEIARDMQYDAMKDDAATKFFEERGSEL